MDFLWGIYLIAMGNDAAGVLVYFYQNESFLGYIPGWV